MALELAKDLSGEKYVIYYDAGEVFAASEALHFREVEAITNGAIDIQDVETTAENAVWFNQNQHQWDLVD